MNKQERIAEAKQKVETLRPEFEKIKAVYDKVCFEYNRACSDLTNAKNSEYEVGERVRVYEDSGNHGRSSDCVGSGVIVELIRYGGWFKVKLDSGKIEEYNKEYVSKS